MNSHKFNVDYFEHGREKHLSWYENYRWIPYISLSIASVLKDIYPQKTILDFGCAKGFTVRALRYLDVNAYGYDISEYAISEAPDDIKQYISCKEFIPQDVIFSKDVLEHIEYSDIETTINLLSKNCSYALIIIPLADNNVYRAAEYELDVTHIIRKDELWWLNMFKANGFKIVNMYYNFHSIKQNWIDKYPYSNGFFLLKSSNKIGI
jgi:2-polyprenyl-3-methyl-5-hydroxy-6-metoxy-1,4-benzoquinol methylase